MNSTYFFRYFTAILMLVWMTSCTTRSEFPIVKKDVDPLRFQIVEDARSALGAKYGYGATGSKRYDCSGLIYSIYSKYSISLPRSTYEMVNAGTAVEKSDLQPGDLVFFKNRNKVDHVAIVSRVSRNKTWLIHSTTSQGVIETPLEDSVYWRPRVVTYRSIIH